MSNSVELDLPSQLTVANVQGLHEEWESIVDDGNNDEIVVNANAVSRADTAGIQLLYALVKAAQVRQISLSWKNPSDTLISAVEVLGMQQQMSIN